MHTLEILEKTAKRQHPSASVTNQIFFIMFFLTHQINECINLIVKTGVITLIHSVTKFNFLGS